MAIIIAAKRHGFRRCGIAHSSEPTLYRDDHFTSAQLQALGQDPQLVVSYVDADLDDQQERLNGTAQNPLLPEAAIASEGAMPCMGQADPAAMGDAGGSRHKDEVLGHDRPSLAWGKSYVDFDGLWDEAVFEDAQRDALILSAKIETLWAAALLEDLQRTADKQEAEINTLWDEAFAEDAQREAAKVKAADKPKKHTGKTGVVDK